MKYEIKHPFPKLIGIPNPPGQPLYLRDHGFSPQTDWFTRHIPIWRKVLEPFADKGANYLEIGVHEGRSFIWVLENIRPAWAVGVDPVDRVTTRLQGDEFEGGWEFYDVPGATALRGLAPNEDKFDIIYIDGDHKAQPTLEHAILAFPLLNPGGLMIFDDYLWHADGPKAKPPEETPKMAVDFFWRVYGKWFDVLHWDWQVILRRKG